MTDNGTNNSPESLVPKTKAKSSGKGIKADPVKIGAVAASATMSEEEAANTATPYAAEAKSRFNAALEEAKAGAAALRAEAGTRASNYSGQAREKSSELAEQARAYGDQALGKAGELAAEGKNVAADLISQVGRIVADTAPEIESRLGPQYADYARTASRSLAETSAKLDAKSVEELGTDAREFVRRSPGVAVGIAAVIGFFIARAIGGGRR